MKAETGIKTSRDYAKKLRELADFLESVPEFNLPSYSAKYYSERGVLETIHYHFAKADFLSAVKAIGKGQKGTDVDQLFFMPANGLIRFSIYQSAICKLVKPAQPAEYECEPLLSQAEEAEISA